MEKRKKRLLKCPKLGRRAERLLLITLPVVLILAVYTAVYIADKDTYEIAAKMDTIYFMLDRLGMTKEQAYVFGDSSNDLAMFEFAVHAVAMGEHDPVLDPYTEFVTKAVEEDGIACALKHYRLI